MNTNFLVQAAISVAASSAAFAQANDDCGSALVLTDGVTEFFDTTASTDSAPAWTCGGTGGADLWYSYTTTQATSVVRIQTCGSSYDTVLEAFTGTCTALNLQACNDDACGFESALTLNSSGAGTTYLIRVGGYDAEVGPGQIIVNESLPLANDDCGGAIPLVTGATAVFDTTNFTDSAPAWTCGGTGGADAWYSYTTTLATSVVRIETCGSSYDTVLEAFTGTCTALNHQGCNDDACGVEGALTLISPGAGTTYLIRVGGYDAEFGPGQIVVSESLPLANDDCGGAMPLTAGTIFDTTTATDSVPAWTCGGAGGADLWYSYTTTQATGRVRIETCGSNYATVLEAFTGTCGALNLVGCNDNYCGGQSTLTITSPGAGTTYLIRVGGDGGEFGAGQISVREIPPPLVIQFDGTPPNGTTVLDFDNPFVASGPIGATAPTFTGVGITSINLVGTWTSGGDTLSAGSNVNGQSLVSDVGGTLTVGGIDEPLDNPEPGAGFDIVLSNPTNEFGVLFSDQIYFRYTVELLLSGMSLGVEEYQYEGPFLGPGHYWTSALGAFDQVILRFQDSGGVGIDEIAFDRPTSLGTSYCAANPNATGVTGAMSASGSTVAANNNVILMASSLPNNQFGIFVVGQVAAFVPNAGGTSNGNICIGGAVGRYNRPGQILSTGSTGSFSLPINLSTIPQSNGNVATMPGDTWFFQAWHRSGLGLGSNFTNGLEVSFN